MAWFRTGLRTQFFVVFCFALAIASPPADSDKIPLDGVWLFRLDPLDLGIHQRWFEDQFTSEVRLPGTTDQNARGFPLDKETMTYRMPHPQWSTQVQVLRTQWPGTNPVGRADEAGQLVREWFYVGKAWYQREIEIPGDWADRISQLRLERVLWKSFVWIDDRYRGSFDSLVTEHRYELGRLEAGKHRLTICVDNSMVHNIGILGHSYTPETQTRWNGIVGDIELTATPPIAIGGLQLFPAADGKSVAVQISLRNADAGQQSAVLVLEIRDPDGDTVYGAARAELQVDPGEQVLEQRVTVTEPVQFWDEFHPVRYQLTARIESGQQAHELNTMFGFRSIQREGRAIRINGRRIFLRGTVDKAVYPTTGYPPMTLDEWLSTLATVKRFGFNHVRFHTWCPPEAAFEAADRLGLYLAPETPFWVDNWTVKTASYPKLLGYDSEVVDFVRNEISRISTAYGNHPSFALFSIGNEFGMDSDWGLVNELLTEIKDRDPRRLYNATGARKIVTADDYWVTHSTAQARTRATGETAGQARTRGLGPPHTLWDFSEALDGVELPIVAHETGQRVVFPNLDELIPKFTGPLRPYNLVRLQEALKSSGLADQAADFTEASASFQYVQHKAEHEAVLRSAELAGYHQLVLNDYTGHSEALAGILDPFFEEKGVITAGQVRQWNSETVLLARFGSYTWTLGDLFSAEVEVAHFGPVDLLGFQPVWSLKTASGKPVAEGRLGPLDVATGGLTKLGRIDLRLDGLSEASALTLEITADRIVNRWPLWAYPHREDAAETEIIIATKFDEATQRAPAGGRSVLFLGHGLKNEKTQTTGFASAYWTAVWWGNEFSSLGVVCDPAHPALHEFPNSGHSDWQWHELTRNATTFLLDEAPAGFRPIVQLVPDFHFNQLLGQVFEARVGAGRLLVCGYDLATDLTRRLAARQMRRSLTRYLQSDKFHPKHQLSVGYLTRLLAD